METSEIKQYKQYVIEALPQKLSSGRWATYVKISRERPGGPRMRAFENQEKSDNRIEAVKACFRFAQRIIDGAVNGSSVEDL